MDRLIQAQEAETATKKEQQAAQEVVQETKAAERPVTPPKDIFDGLKRAKAEKADRQEPEKPAQAEAQPSAYLKSFENMTVADIRREEEAKALAQFEKEKEKLIEKAYEKPAEEPVNIIEKPNYDLLEENKKVIKLSRQKSTKSKKKFSKKAGVALAITLGISGILCVTNTVLLENMGGQLSQIEETYNFNLQRYLRDINNLDATKKSMEFLETYPDDMLDAGDIGEKSNWFDKLCNFLGGLFGG